MISLSITPLQRVGAGVACLNPAGEVLIRRRDNGYWDVPGGRVEVGEEVSAAARRELREETGLEAGELPQLLGVFSGPDTLHTYPDGNVVAWVTVPVHLPRLAGHPRPRRRCPRAGLVLACRLFFHWFFHWHHAAAAVSRHPAPT